MPRTRKSTRFDVVVVGGASWDYLVRGRHLPGAGEIVQGERSDEGPGGKGCNQAVAVARLGARVAFVGCVGRDERGDRIIDRLSSERVDITRVKRDVKASTGISLIHVDERGEKQVMTCPGANAWMSEQHVRDASDVIADAKVVLCQLEIPLGAVVAALTVASDARARTVLDPAPPMRLPEGALRLVEVIRPNAAETEVLVGIRPVDRESARKAAEMLLGMGPKAAAIPAGVHGDLLVWKGGEVWLPRHDVRVVDATGAGDAFSAAIAAMLAEGAAYADVGPFASAAAALQTTGFGAQSPLPSREAVKRYLAGARRRPNASTETHPS